MNDVKNLPYVSYRETNDLDNTQVTYVDYSVDTKNGTNPDVYMMKIKCGAYEIDTLDELPAIIESFFITTVKGFKDRYHTIEKKVETDEITNDTIKNTIVALLEALENRRGAAMKGRPEESFVILPKDLQLSLDNVNVLNSESLTDEIIIGKKTLVDQPGLLLVTNDEGLKDRENIRFGLLSLGFKPEESYYILKLK